VNAATLRTAAWYGDHELELPFPESWEVSIRWPQTPPRLTDEQIEAAVRNPVGQPRISELARGAKKPVVIIDDLTRPTPTARVVPFVLRELEAAGIAAAGVTFVIASGTHAAPDSIALAKKAGPEATSSCRVVAHDDRARDLVSVGRTSYGTPVLVNQLVAASDYVLGIGGIYPQYSAGFGGGAKLALGVLGRRSIRHLHYGHPSMDGALDVDNDFRRDLSEVARMIGLRTSISAHVDANRDIVRLVCGAHDDYYADAVAFSHATYTTQGPGTADVVIANAYPIDVSLTFMRSKGILPLLRAAPGASRVIVAACPEGAGHHALFPFITTPRFERPRQLARRVMTQPRELPALATSAVARVVAGSRPSELESRQPIHLYPPGREAGSLPREIPGMTPAYSWGEILARVAAEQGDGTELRATVYPCAPLQIVGAG
jgi:nickel-dependent lactate racemase